MRREKEGKSRGPRRSSHSCPCREGSIAKVKSLIELNKFGLPIVLLGTRLKKESSKRWMEI